MRHTLQGLILLVVLLPGWAGAASYGACTAGVDCYCDRVRGGDLNDPSLIWCEDWDSPDWYGTNAANSWAAGIDYGGGYYDRGGASRWVTEYTGATWLTSFRKGYPGSPYIGSTCGPNSDCSGAHEWCSAAQSLAVRGVSAENCWGPDGYSGKTVNHLASLDIQRPGDWNAENPAWTLTGGNNGAVFSGNQHMAMRVCAGNINQDGDCQTDFSGDKKFGGVKSELGVTYALAYSSDIDSSGIWVGPWKHWEWYKTDDGSHYEYSLDGGGQAIGGASARPFSTFMFNTGAAACQNALNAATTKYGQFECGDGYFNFAPDVSYSQSTNFAWGQWHCVQAHYVWSGGYFGLTKWVDGTKIFDLQQFATSALVSNTGYGGVKLNAYANANQSQDANWTTRTALRYYDNIHVRQGAPVSCSQIGFGETPPSPPISPVYLRVTVSILPFLLPIAILLSSLGMVLGIVALARRRGGYGDDRSVAPGDSGQVSPYGGHADPGANRGDGFSAPRTSQCENAGVGTPTR